MDEYIRNIVVISGNDGSAAVLRTRVDPVKFTKPAAMALRNICYGEVFNIHEGNNNVYLSLYERIPDNESLLALQRIITKSIRIKTGRYNDRVAVLEAIDFSIQEALIQHMEGLYDPTFIQFTFQREKKVIVTLVKQKSVFITDMDRTDTPWSLLGIENFQSPIANASLDNGTQIAFLYCNVVENSYINNKKSRVLAVVPLARNNGCTFLEFTSPIYVPIDVRQFNNILLEMRDVNGKLVPFDNKYKTVITLHIKTMK